MDKLKEKAMHFVAALLDVYKDEEKRELHMLPKIELEDDFTEDVTAMLVAMCIVYNKITGEDDDLIGFTHSLNRFAIQYLFEPKEEDDNE